MTRLLVYGTLRRGERAHSALKGSEFVTEARVPGFDMYALYGFPGVKVNEKNQDGIVGEVFDVNDNTLAYLDYYEGYFPDNRKRSHFIRETVEIEGKPTELYVYNHDVEDALAVAIPTGNWKEK